MSKSVRIRRGTTLDHQQFAGAEGEITVDTTLDTIRVHDGSQLGGYPLLNSAKNSVITSPELIANKVLARNTYPNQTAFPTASDYPGTLVYSQADNKAYYSNGTAWVSFTQPSDLSGFVTGSIDSSSTGQDRSLTLAKVGTNLRFRTLRQGNNITISQDGTSLTIASDSYSGANLNDTSGSFGIYKTTDDALNQLQFRSLRFGAGIQASQSPSANEIAVDTFLKQAYNTIVAGSTSIPTNDVNNTFTLSPGTGITITGNSGTKTATFAINLTATNDSAQSGSGVLKSYSAGGFVFNKVSAGDGVVLSTGTNGEIVISAPQVGTITGAESLGVSYLTDPVNGGVALYDSGQSTSATLKFRRVRVGTGLTVVMSPDSNYMDLALTSQTPGGAQAGVVGIGAQYQLAYYPLASASSQVGPTPSGISIDVVGNKIVADITGTVSSLSNHTTSSLAEGTNLYYTQGRFDSAFAAKTTDNLTEGSTNLYFQAERAQDAVRLMLDSGNPTPSTATVTTTANSTSTATLFFASTSGMSAGQVITNANFPLGATVQTVNVGNIIVSPAVYAPLGTSVTFTGGAGGLIVNTTANSTSTAVLTVNGVSNIAAGWYVTGAGITGQVVVQSVGSTTITVTPGYNVSVATAVPLTFSALTSTGIAGVYDDPNDRYTYRLDTNFLGNIVRNALSVIPNQGLSYDPVQGRFGLAGAVTSVNGFSGAVTLAVGDISGAAKIDSQTFTGTPRVPNLTVSSSSFQIANKQYVDDTKTAITGSPITGLATLQAIGNAIGGDVQFSQTVSSNLNTKLNLSGGTLTGSLFLAYIVGSSDDPNIAVNKRYVDGIALVQTVNSKQGNIVLNADDILERVSPAPVNIYFTNTRARAAISLSSDNNSILSYAPVTGVFTFTTPNTDQITQGSTNEYWTASKSRSAMGINVTGNSSFASYNSSNGVYTINATTDNLSQGTTNKFYTDALARASITLATNTAQTSAMLTYNSSTGQFSINPNTDRLTEGVTNLFFTSARAQASVSAVVTTSTGVTTGNIFTYNNATGVFTFNNNTNSMVEGANNLFFTTVRARTSISATGSINYDSSTGIISYTTPTTDGITEGSTNQYFTQARARGSVSAAVTQTAGVAIANALTYSSSTGTFTFNANLDNIAEGTTNKFASLSVVAGRLSLSTTTSDGVVSVSSMTATGTGSVQTYSFSNYGSTPFGIGTTVYVQGFSTAGYNGTFTVLSSPAPSATGFSVSGSATGSVSGGFATATPLIIYNNLTGVTAFNNSTDSLREGTTNLYYTPARVRAQLSIASNNAGVITYNNSTGVFTPSISVNGLNLVYTANADGSTTKTFDLTQNIYANSRPVFQNVNRYTVPFNANEATTTTTGRITSSSGTLTINLALGHYFDISRDATNGTTITAVNFTNGPSVAKFATTAATSSSGTSTITFASQASPPFAVGSSITVAGVTPTGFNGTYTVTACTTTSVSFAGSTAGPQTVAGTVQSNAQYQEVVLSFYNVAAVSPTMASVTNIKWAGGTQPTWSTALGYRDIVKIYSVDYGATWYELYRSLGVR